MKGYDKMKFNDRMQSVEQKIPWSFLGFLIGIIFGVFGIYSVFFYAKAPDLRVEILSSTPVFSIQENVQDLDIIFKGENLRQSRQALTLTSLKLINRGNVPVKSGDFDPKDPLAICLNDGKLIKSDILETSEDYLDKVFAETTNASQSIVFPSFIMEPGHFILLRMLILHDEGAEPKLSIKGKVANVPNIDIVESFKTEDARGKGSIAISGDIIVQIIRVGIYGFGFIVTIVVIAVLFAFINDKIQKQKRNKIRLSKKKCVDDFLNSLDLKQRLMLEPIARTLLANDRLTVYLLDHLDDCPENLNYNELSKTIEMHYPDFRREYFQSPEVKKKITQLIIQLSKIMLR